MMKVHKSRKEQRIIIILLLMVLAVLGGLLMKNKDSGIKLDEKAKIYDGVMIRPEDWDENQIAIPGYGILQMEENTSILPVNLVNPSGNPCYFKFTLYLKGKNEAIYISDYIEPGYSIDNLQLNQAIAPGKHDLIIDIETISLHDRETKMNGSQINTEIATYER